MTTFADGLQQNGGVPVGIPGLDISKIMAQSLHGRAWFVSPAGDNTDGKSPQGAFTTMTRAFANIASGDIIYLIGKVTEQLVTPVQIFDVTVVGCGNLPRHADSTPAGGQYGSAQWSPPASGGVAAQATVRVIQQGWRFVNILFTAVDANAACIEVVRNAASGDDERDGSHCDIGGCRFSGTGIGVRITAASFTENPFNVRIHDNTFNSMTQAILASSAQPNGAQIRNNVMFACTKNITAKLQNSFVIGNYIGQFTAAANSGGIDLAGGAATNVVTLNYLSGTYSIAGGYAPAGGGDEWAANMNVTAGGWTAADPA